MDLPEIPEKKPLPVRAGRGLQSTENQRPITPPSVRVMTMVAERGRPATP